jgi:dTDP-4-dehydrorhamnose reductase
MCPSAMVCRVSWIFGTDPPGFLRSVLNRARAGEDLEFVADKWSTPSSVGDIARATEFLLGHPDLSGVIHVTNPGEGESWWSYGRKVIRMAVEEGVLEREVRVRPAKLADIPQLSVPRPIHTALAPGRLRDELGWELRPWEEAAREQIRAMGRAGESH